MNGEKLYKERTLPCLNELYAAAECVNGKTYTFDQLHEYAPYMQEEGKRVLPTGAFYIDKKLYDEIVEKHSKRLPYYWRFPYRSEIYPKGKAWEELKRKHEENPDDKDIAQEYENTLEYMRRDALWKDYYKRLCDIDEKRKNKEITGPEAKKMRDDLAKEFDCQHRSNERESIGFMCAFYGPTFVRGYFDKVKTYYEGKSPEEKDYSLAQSDAKVFMEFEKGFNIRPKNKANA